MTRKHQSGPNSKNPGAWVNCPAQHQCRNNSLHINSDMLYPARKLHEIQTGERISRVAALPLDVVENYINSSPETKEETVDALMEEVRVRNEKAKERNPGLVATEAGYESLKKLYMDSHLPPVMKEKTVNIIQPKTGSAKRVVTGELTSENVATISGMFININIEDSKEMKDALSVSFRKLTNLTSQQRKTLLWAMNDIRSIKPRTDGQTPGLIQLIQANFAINLLQSIIKTNKQGNLARSTELLNTLESYYGKVITRVEERDQAKKLREEEATAKQARKLSTRIKNLFKNSENTVS